MLERRLACALAMHVSRINKPRQNDCLDYLRVDNFFDSVSHFKLSNNPSLSNVQTFQLKLQQKC